jgi:hypothetical protein
MGIDYVVDLGCPPKETFSTSEIMAMVKARGRAEAVMELARAHGDLRSADAFQFELVIETPAGVEQREVSAQELFDQSLPLTEHGHHCAGCAANGEGGVLPDAYGCYGNIPYPISPATEAWLMSLFPDDLETTAGVLLLRALEDFEWNGAYAASMREQDGTFFLSPDPAFRRWDLGGGSGLELTSDQAFDMIFGVEHLEPAHAVMLCLFFGILPGDLDPSELADLMADRARLAACFRRGTMPEEPEGGSQGMRRFFAALKTSASLGVTLLIDG